ncbi:MAG: hypothetical protein U0793_16675 [Gemmataceae bacterium]
MDPWIWIAGGVVGLVLVVWLLRRLRTFGGVVQVERAKEMFRLQRERLEAHFVRAASQSGKPRGLLWKDCQFQNDTHYVRERKTGQIAALVGVTIAFEAVPGGDMEGLPAVNNLRTASAVFFFQAGHWLTVGKAVFNMSPDEAIRHFQNQYERLD